MAARMLPQSMEQNRVLLQGPSISDELHGRVANTSYFVSPASLRFTLPFLFFALPPLNLADEDLCPRLFVVTRIFFVVDTHASLPLGDLRLVFKRVKHGDVNYVRDWVKAQPKKSRYARNLGSDRFIGTNIGLPTSHHFLRGGRAPTSDAICTKRASDILETTK